MRTALLIVALASTLGLHGCSRTNARPTTDNRPSGSSARVSAATSPGTATDSAKVNFTTQVRPILEAKCQPCHFNGGKVYSQMPFDRPETIKRLGTKLFTRIKDENERQMIRAFLEQE
jgi:hypothetical protein